MPALGEIPPWDTGSNKPLAKKRATYTRKNKKGVLKCDPHSNDSTQWTRADGKSVAVRFRRNRVMKFSNKEI